MLIETKMDEEKSLMEKFKEVVYRVNQKWFGDEKALEAIQDNISPTDFQTNLDLILSNIEEHREDVIDMVSTLSTEEPSPQKDMLIRLYQMFLGDQ